jgi:tRNA-specific 2-thiouridylase
MFTVGQRHGLGAIAGLRRNPGEGGAEPLYVVRLDPEQNTVEVGGGDSLWRSSLLVENPSFVSGVAPVGATPVTAKVRYRSPETAATILLLPDGRLRVDFAEAQRAITPGQAIVFYEGEEVLGGGLITSD